MFDIQAKTDAAHIELDNALQAFGKVVYGVKDRLVMDSSILIMFDTSISSNIHTLTINHHVENFDLQVNVHAKKILDAKRVANQIKTRLLQDNFEHAENILFSNQPQIFWDDDLQSYTQTIIFSFRAGDI